VDAPTATVSLVSWAGSAPSGDPSVRLDEQIASQLGSQCATPSGAEAIVSSDAPGQGFTAADYAVTAAGTVAPPGGGCARAFVEAGGSIQIVIWQVPQG
jgi:hypothetical protein